MENLKRVLILTGKSREFDRGIIRGIAKFVRLNAAWIVLAKPQPYLSKERLSKFVSEILTWKPDGVIFSYDELIPEIKKLPIPQIITGDIQDTGYFQFVANSNTDMIGRMAADHLLSRGLTNFAYCGYNGLPFSLKRQIAFHQNLAEKGFKVHLYKQPKIKSEDKKQLIGWLKSLPKPIGLMCCNDDRGQELLQICQIIQIKVPDEIAVIGVDDDSLVCEFTVPPLSSIALNSDIVGYKIAETLDKMMYGEKPTDNSIIIEPTNVHIRLSTDFIATDDPIVSQAMRYIQKNSHLPLQVDDVADYVMVSSRVLQQRFKRSLNRTIISELQRTRIEKMAQFLRETDLTVAEISHKMGFPGFEHVSRCFKKQMALSPTEYRSKCRL